MEQWKIILVDYCDYNSQLLKGYGKVMRRGYAPTLSDRIFMDMKTGCSIISKHAVFLALECCLRADCLICWGWSSIMESKVVRVGKMVYVEPTANTSAPTHNNTGGQVSTLHHYTHQRRGAKQAHPRSSLNPTEVSRKHNGQHLQSALKEKSLERDKPDPLCCTGGFRSHLKTVQTCEHLHPSGLRWARRSWLGTPWGPEVLLCGTSAHVCVGWGAADLSRLVLTE